MSEIITYRLDEIADVIDCEHKTAPKVDSSDYYSIRTPDIKNGRLLYEQANRVSAETYELWTKRGIPEAGDIILAREAPVGEVGWIDKDHKICLGQRTVLIKIHSIEIDKKYLLYSFVSPKFKDYLNELSGGSVVAHLNMKDIRALEFSFPPLPEQKAIASVLSSLDDKIDLLHRQNKTLEAMAETLFRQWFIEEAKEDWEEADLTQLIGLQSGYAFKSKDFQESGNFGVIKIKNISGNIIDIEQTDFVSDEVGLATAQRFNVSSGQVLVAMTGAEIGKLGLVPKTTKKLLLNQRVGLLEPKFIGAQYLAYLHLKSEFGQDYIENSATGSAQPNISGSLIEACPFPKVEDSILQQYGKQVQIYFVKVKENLGQIQTLEQLRDTLLPKIMSGEVRIQYQTEEVA
jgi:type I restriction enzyme S subunit